VSPGTSGARKKRRRGIAERSCPSEYSHLLLVPCALPQRAGLLWVSPLVQSLGPAPVSPHGFGDPALPLALAPAMRFFRHKLRRPQSSNRQRALFGLGDPLEFCPASTSRSAAAARPLPWTLAPYSTYRLSRSTVCRHSKPAKFRLQGLATLLTASSRESRAGFISRRQRSWDSPFGAFSSRRVSDAFPRRMNPHAVPSAGCCASRRPDRRTAAPGL
jgi:hypothetical protein